MQQMPGMQQMMPAQLGLPMWAKLLIAGLSLIALIALALVIYVVILGGLKPSPGSLMINVQPPSAEIVVDGEVVATKSPFNLNGLEPKTYVVEARKSGYKSVIRPVKITAGEPRVETIVLEPDGERAGVLVRSVPEGLAIWVDGKDTGQVTPSTLSGLVAGDHELELRQGADVVHQRSLSLKPGGVDGVDVDITKIPPVLEVRSNQVGARVFVEDRPVGATPIKIDTLRPGKVTVRVEMKDCQPYSARAELKQAVTTLLDAELSCKGAAGKGADEMGKVNVTATTVADVFIDGKKVGRTPALGLRVPVGSHIVKLVPLSGDKPPHTEEIVVEPMPKLVSLDHRF
jgi:hypothetical protein